MTYEEIWEQLVSKSGLDYIAELNNADTPVEIVEDETKRKLARGATVEIAIAKAFGMPKILRVAYR